MAWSTLTITNDVKPPWMAINKGSDLAAEEGWYLVAAL
jgi:hypothetical protein